MWLVVFSSCVAATQVRTSAAREESPEALIERALEEFRSTTFADRREAIERMAALRERCVPRMVQALESTNQSVRFGAAKVLSRIGVAIVPDLVARSRHSPVLVRVGIQRAIGEMTPRVSGDVVLDLIDGTARSDEELREAARSMYVPREITPAGLTILRALITGGGPCEVCTALLAMSLGVQSPDDPLGDAGVAAGLLSSDVVVRDEVVRTLWSEGVPIGGKTTEALSQWLDDDRLTSFTWRRGGRCVIVARRRIVAAAALARWDKVPLSLTHASWSSPQGRDDRARLAAVLRWNAGLCDGPPAGAVAAFAQDERELFAYAAARRASMGHADGIDWVVELLSDPADGVACALTTVDREVRDPLVARLLTVLRTPSSIGGDVRGAAILLVRIERYRSERRGLAARVAVELDQLHLRDRASLIRSLVGQLELVDPLQDVR